MARTIANLMVVIGANATALEKALTKSEKRINKFGRTATAAGENLTKSITLPAIVAGGAAIKVFGDFEKAMVGSTAIMGKVSDEMRDKMETAAREVAKTTKFSATQAAESYFYLASAGMDAAQSIEALPRVAKFAQAGNFDMALATDLLTDAQSALGMTIRDDVVKNMENMNRVSDVLVKANTLANASVQQFSEALTNKAGAALRLLNKDVEEGVAVLAVFADQGRKGEAAGESLAIVLRDLQRASIKNRDEFKKFGVGVYDAQGNMNNMAAIVGDLEGALKGMSDEQVRTTLMMMGFQDKSVANIMALLGTSEAIRKYEEQLKKAGGITQEVADKQLRSLWAQLGLVKNRLVDMGITLGDILGSTMQSTVLPMVDHLIDKLNKAAEWFAGLTKEEQESILKMAAFAVAVGPVLLILGKTASAITSLIGLFKIFGGAKVIGLAITGIQALSLVLRGATAATIAQGVAAGTITPAVASLAVAFNALTWPIALAVAAFAALVVGGVLLYKNLDTVKEKASQLWKYLGETFDGIKESVSATWNDAISWGENIVMGLWNGISSKAAWIRDKVTGFVSGIGSTIKDFFGIESPSKLMAEYGRYITEGLAMGIENNAPIVFSAAEKMATAIIDATNKIKNGVTLSVDIAQAKFDLLKAKMGETSNAAQLHEAQLALLSTQMTASSDKISVLTKAYEDMARVKGKAATESQQLLLDILREQAAQERLGKTIAETNKIQKEKLTAGSWLGGIDWDDPKSVVSGVVGNALQKAFESGQTVGSDGSGFTVGGIGIGSMPLMDTGGIVKGPGVFQVGAGVTEVVRRYDGDKPGEPSVTNHYHFAPGAIVIPAEDVAEFKETTDFFARLPQAARAY